ncbi:MAG TPA: twin-arginine translocase TatA/TatE family subunit [Flavobacteriaceae bacterium]|nr:twin-arginine translocase TatA/TatE family subunit [Flavobacteriaceae bacterium]
MIFTGSFLIISIEQIVFVLFVALLLFGADKVPEIARNLGRIISQVKNAANDVKNEIVKSAEKQDLDLDITQDVQKEIDKVKEEIEDISGPVKRTFK